MDNYVLLKSENVKRIQLNTIMCEMETVQTQTSLNFRVKTRVLSVSTEKGSKSRRLDDNTSLIWTVIEQIKH